MDERMVFLTDFFSWRQANGKKTPIMLLPRLSLCPASWFSRWRSCCAPASYSKNACWLGSHASRAQVGFRKFHWPQGQERGPEHVQRDPSWPNLMWLWVRPREQTQRRVHPEIHSAGDVPARALVWGATRLSSRFPDSDIPTNWGHLCIVKPKNTCNGCNNRLYGTFYMGAKAKSSHNIYPTLETH